MSASLDVSVQGLRVVGVSRVVGRYQGAPRRLHERLTAVLQDEAEMVAELARARLGELFHNPGQMQAAIQVSTAEGINTSSAVSNVSVYASGLPYLRIHEYGGVVATPEINTAGNMMHWLSPAWAQFRPGSEAATGEVFTRHTNAHPTPIPERSYLRYALAQRASAIRARFAEASIDSIKGPS